MLILDFDVVLILLFYFTQHYTNQPCTHIFYLDYCFIFSSVGSRNRIVYVLNEIEQMNKSFWSKVVKFYLAKLLIRFRNFEIESEFRSKFDSRWP